MLTNGCPSSRICAPPISGDLHFDPWPCQQVKSNFDSWMSKMLQDVVSHGQLDKFSRFAGRRLGRATCLTSRALAGIPL